MIYVEKDNQLELVDLDRLTLNKHSHHIFTVECDLKISAKCRNRYKMEFRQYIKLTEANGGKLPCIFCSRTLKFSNRNNPNTKYLSIDDNLFVTIDNSKKAYLLGWIASDGHIGIRGFIIKIHKKDEEILKALRDIVSSDIPIKYHKTSTSDLCSFEVNSRQISRDLCKWLKIKPGKKSHTVKFPEIDEKYIWDFIRGYFDGDGTINDPNKTIKKCPKFSIRSSSNDMLVDLKNKVKIRCYITEGHSVAWENKYAFEFGSRLYENHNELFLKRKRDRYENWKINAK